MPTIFRRAHGPAKGRVVGAAVALGLAVTATLLSSIAGAASVTLGASADTSLSSTAYQAVTASGGSRPQ